MHESRRKTDDPGILRPSSHPNLNSEHWQALIALHRTLLHGHSDFFLLSQRPSANLAGQRLASKCALHVRMWWHGIHSFLELLRHPLLDYLGPMLAFIYTASENWIVSPAVTTSCVEVCSASANVEPWKSLVFRTPPTFPAPLGHMLALIYPE